MKSKKKIVEIVYEHTFSPGGKYRHYLSIVDLCSLFDFIIKSNETTEYVAATPFYITIDRQEEFDNYMFFCKKLTKGENADEFLRKCNGDIDGRPCKGIIRCYEENDIFGFQKALQDYQLYVKTVADEIYEFLTKECNVKNKDLLLGSICFEVTAE